MNQSLELPINSSIIKENNNGSPVFFHKNQLKKDIQVFKREISFIKGLDSKSEWEEERSLKIKRKEEERLKQLELYEQWVFIRELKIFNGFFL